MFIPFKEKCLCGAKNESGAPCDACSKMTRGVGRILLALIFVFGGYGKLVGFAGTAGMIGGAGFPLPVVLTVLAIIFEFGGGVALLLGYCTRYAALALVVFTILATLMFHMSGLGDQMQQIALLKNLAIIGGLLFVFAGGAGAWSLDNRKRGEF